MNQASNKIIALIAVLLFAAKGKAEATNNINDEKVNFALMEIQQAAQTQPDLLSQLLVLKKSQIEESLQLDLTDSEFETIHQLIGKLLNEGVELSPTPIGKIIIATQEYAK